MAVGLLQIHTYFLNRTEQEVDSMTFEGLPLIKSNRINLGYGMYGVLYTLSQAQKFLLHFDSDFGGRVTVQKTYWGNESPRFYQRLKVGKVNYRPSFQTDGFCVSSPELGNVLVEFIDDMGIPCVMTSINI